MPEGQLLEMDLNDGWGPLCQFLNVLVSSEPFPKVNDVEAADKYATKVILTTLGVWLGIFTVTAVTLYPANTSYE